ncbi:hypothetical protein HPB50_021471 [Hyalomma asiaticum]|uniref:Uncharacterized protein n=1 Tax=Hyalomma asiaticum TaxID=266040 RepID=A0ACB7T9U9_HYAAI|nr:hypothetical protein HPB50_021471 [Hyalomma asiaticum]
MPAVCLFSVSVLSGVGSNGVIGPEHQRCFARIFVRDVSSRYRKRNCTPCLPGSKVLPVLTFVVHLFVLAHAEVGPCSKHGTWENGNQEDTEDKSRGSAPVCAAVHAGAAQAVWTLLGMAHG